MGNEIWLWFEHREGEISPVCFELATAGRQIARSLTSKVTALVAGSAEITPPSWAGLTDRILYIDDEQLRNGESQACADAMAHLADEQKPLLIIFPDTARAGDLAPRLSYRIKAPLASGCVEIGLKNGELVFTRPVFSGHLCEVTAADLSPIKLASIRLGSYTPAKPLPRAPEVLVVQPRLNSPSKRAVRIRKCFKVNPREIDIARAEVVVAGGRGVGKENFVSLQELADILEGSLAGSRMAVDLGWIPYERQIGLTGKAVAAKVLLTFGISGAFEFLAGIKDARGIIAVNRDSKAPIFRVADLGIAEEMEKILPELLRLLKENA